MGDIVIKLIKLIKFHVLVVISNYKQGLLFIESFNNFLINEEKRNEQRNQM